MSLKKEVKASLEKEEEPLTEEELESIIEQRMEEMFGQNTNTSSEEVPKKTHSGFKTNSIGPYIETRQIKAMMRNTMSHLGITVERKGTKATLKGLVRLIACLPPGTPLDIKNSDQINFWKSNENHELEVISKPDGTHQMVVHANTPRGVVTAVKQHDYVENARIFFLIEVPANLPSNRTKATLRDKEIEMILGHAGRSSGLGACHSTGAGRFTIASLQRLTDIPWVQKAN